MNEQQVPLDQISNERLAVIAWETREKQDALRREADSMEQTLLVIRGELFQRAKLIEKLAQEEKDKVSKN